jgi:hypothetical protein
MDLRMDKGRIKRALSSPAQGVAILKGSAIDYIVRQLVNTINSAIYIFSAIEFEMDLFAIPTSKAGHQHPYGFGHA